MRTELVGREPEFAALTECLAAALDGRSQLVLCQGEPGIGKTRLAHELVGMMKSVPGFVRGTWTTDGSRGLSFIVFESEEAARGVADNASMPPDASVTFVSVDVYEVVRDA